MRQPPCSQRQACSTVASVTTSCGVVWGTSTWKESGTARGRMCPLTFHFPRCRYAAASTSKPGMISATPSTCGGTAAARRPCLSVWHEARSDHASNHASHHASHRAPCFDAGTSCHASSHASDHASTVLRRRCAPLNALNSPRDARRQKLRHNRRMPEPAPEEPVHGRCALASLGR